MKKYLNKHLPFLVTMAIVIGIGFLAWLGAYHTRFLLVFFGAVGVFLIYCTIRFEVIPVFLSFNKKS